MATKLNSFSMMCFHALAGRPKDPQPATPPKAILVSRYRFPSKSIFIRYGHWLGAVGICLYALAQSKMPRCTGPGLFRRKLATIRKSSQDRSCIGLFDPSPFTTAPSGLVQKNLNIVFHSMLWYSLVKAVL
ncbi:hypothetical protein PCANC_04214 [Puccinia coronata f. sp. avenae]|uniref:Uncharacterized protein n=1 Tax=Puccinia coronata f. sp. avenae TaxID=200324 RepID=A0A2N5VX14_9BASI|nr:hypothetical protein PCANC_04214 [Puccinia coronata f. sp. avenae]